MSATLAFTQGAALPLGWLMLFLAGLSVVWFSRGWVIRVEFGQSITPLYLIAAALLWLVAK